MDELEAIGVADRGPTTPDEALGALEALGVASEHVSAIRGALTRKRRRKLILLLGTDYLDPPIYWLAVALFELYELPGPFEPGP